MNRIKVFLQNNKLFWIPLVVAVFSLWIFAGTAGICAHISAQVYMSKIGEAGFNILTFVLIICAISFWSLFIYSICVKGEDNSHTNSYTNHPGFILSGFIAVLMFPIMIVLICHLSLILGWFIFFLMGYHDYFNSLARMLLFKPGPTFILVGIILANYIVLGLILGTGSLIIRNIKKKKK
jgi:hypothetical protein